MNKLCRFTTMICVAGMLLAAMAVPSFAASRKKITSVSVDVTSEILPGMRYGEEEIEVEVRSGKCHFESYEVNNIGFEWTDEDVPEVTIYLQADEGYYFSLTRASAVKLKGATYVKASKQNSSETLVLTVKLPSLAETVDDQGEVTLSENAYAVWEPVRGAGSYEVRLYRNGTGMGASILTTANTYYDFSGMMTRQGSYYARVRPVNKVNTDVKGEWAESTSITLTPEQANAIRNGTADRTRPVIGEWIQDDKGWYYRHDDGSCTKNNWEEIKDQWYFFDENGYMKTGWIEWNGLLYYCDDNTGAMLKDTMTPDGYILDHNGNRKTD